MKIEREMKRKKKGQEEKLWWTSAEIKREKKSEGDDFSSLSLIVDEIAFREQWSWKIKLIFIEHESKSIWNRDTCYSMKNLVTKMRQVPFFF